MSEKNKTLSGLLKKVFFNTGDNNKSEDELSDIQQEGSSKNKKTVNEKMIEEGHRKAELRRQKRKKKKENKNKDIIEKRGKLTWVNKNNNNTIFECYDENKKNIFTIKRGMVIFELNPTKNSNYSKKHFSTKVEDLKKKVDKIIRK